MNKALSSTPCPGRRAGRRISRATVPIAASARASRSSQRGNFETTLTDEVDALARLSRSDLVSRWKSILRSDPPKNLGQALLLRVLAYELQAKQLGGLRTSLRRAIAQRASGEGGQSKLAAATISLKPGTRLLRDWNGTTHVVDVTDAGYVWNGKSHRSLSAIAREITGARWSGPRFFGIQ
jgi:hypothetical protein